MHRHIAALLRALAFLSRYPVAAAPFRGGPHPLAADAAAFPVAGLLIALPAALTLWLALRAGLSPATAALAATALLVLTGGALHEDGLADTADGLFGHHGSDRALLIMKDSRLGTYGGLALILSLLLRTAFLADIAVASAGAGVAALLASAAASRGGMVALWHALPSARAGGIADRQGRPARGTAVVALALSGLILAPGGWLASGPLAVLAAAGLSVALFAWFRAVLRRRLGGQTGDTLGAFQQMLDIAILGVFALAAGLSVQ